MKRFVIWLNLLSHRNRFMYIILFSFFLTGLILAIYFAVKIKAAQLPITNVAQIFWDGGSSTSNPVVTEVTSNSQPQNPTNVSPSNGENYINPGKIIVLVKSNFSDPDNDSQAKYQFQITQNSGNYSSPIVDSGEVSSSSNNYSFSTGALVYGTQYYWHVKVQDNAANSLWSDWSSETSFTTCQPGMCNGDLIKTNSAPHIYLISVGKKCHITTWQSFLAYNFNINQITIISNSQMDAIQNGAAVNRLLISKAYPEIYFMSQGKKYWITSPQIFLSLGFRWQDVFFSDDSFIASFEQETPIRRLAKSSSDNKVYILFGQPGKGGGSSPLSKKWIVSPDIYVSMGFAWNEIETISSSELDSYPTSSPLYKTILAEGDNRVYLMSSGVKHWITSPAAFVRLGLDWGKITVLKPGMVEAYPEGLAIY